MSSQKLTGGYQTACLSRNAEIVVSGMSGKFPNSHNVEEFMHKLLNKVHLCDEDERRSKITHPEIPKLGGKIYDVDNFDNGYFGIHSFQSLHTDPSGRIFLEQVVEALFDAGIHPDELKGTRTGVFNGACCSEYEMLLMNKRSRRNTGLITGTTRSMIAQRVSFFLQLNGPSYNCDTACSSGMYALEAAYRSILEGRCDRAIVGGTNLCLDPYMTLQFGRLGVLSYGCGCRPFDDDASGYTRAEAIVAVILQKQVEAKRIYAKIVHIKSNADGFKSQGITFPSFEGQLQILQEVYQEANINPTDIGFLEAHGTGTKVGDPEEVSVIDKFFAPSIQKPLMIGSVKGNIGHSEPSAGLCSLVKVLCALNFGTIPPNIHFDKPRTGVKALEEKRLKVVKDVTPFPLNKKLAGVNCFGFGGANAHVIVERCTKSKTTQIFKFPQPRLVCYSGRTQEAVNEIHEHISTCTDVEYIGLLQESFKRPFNNHLYRGFTLIGAKLKSNKILTNYIQQKLILVMGNFQNLRHFDDLIQIPLLKNIYQDVKTTLTSMNRYNANQAMQLTLLKTFMELSLDMSLLIEDKLSIIVEKYIQNMISFPELIQQLIETNNNNVTTNTQINESLKLWINGTSKYGNKASIAFIGNYEESLNDCLTKQCNLLQFGDQITTEELLFNIGRLYEEGFNPQVHKFYPKIEFPVSCGTNMLSHLVKWKHHKFDLLQWSESTSYDFERRECINLANPELLFYRGHLIDNRNLFPATGYLWYIWNLFADLRDLHPNELSVVFENVRFHRACTFSQERINFHSVVHADGNFEVSENSVTVVTGCISVYDEGIEGVEEFTREEENNAITDRNYVLTEKDAYKELRLRGYNYRGLFRGINEVGPTEATIKWENNWVTFLDNMMQVCILQEDNRNLYVPVGIERLVIRSKEHLKYIEVKEEKLVPVYFIKNTQSLHSKFIEMRGLNARSIARRKNRVLPVLESYQFIPNEYTTALKTSLRINMQILLECKQTVHFNVVEVIRTEEEEVISSEICNVIEDMPLILPGMTVVTPNEGMEIENVNITATITEKNLLFVCKNPDEAMLRQADKALIEDGFLLCVSNSDCVFTDNFLVLTKHMVEEQRIVYLLRKKVTDEHKSITVNISDNKEISWLKQLQDAMQNYDDVILFAENNSKSGILGLINCLTKEPGGDKARCVFVQNSTAKFDANSLINDGNVKTQVEKRMPINVFYNGEWGTYRHLLLPNLEQKPSFHWYANTIHRGELSTLSWIQGPTTANNVAKINPIKIMYSALNFRDLMLASGKLSEEVITRDRFLQERTQGFEFAGIDSSGKRVCGLGAGAIANMIEFASFTVDVPDTWLLEDAATICVVYCTVIWALQKMGNLKRGQSVLIHSGTGGIGLAAMNLCTYFECDIYVTVGTKEKRDFLLHTYSNLKASHIGNSRNTNFKEMIMRETNGHGVDIVLNSLAEEKLLASVDCLAFGGVFLEIGKYDLDKNNVLPMTLARKECSYRGVMLDELLMDKASPEDKREMKELIATGIQKGYVKPLPRKVFQIDELLMAYKFMSAGKHIGKLLIQIDHEKINHEVVPRMYCDPNCSYIVFGGLGGLGLELVDWLVTRGAKNLILSSRKGVTTGYQRYRIELWKSFGIKISISLEDATNYESCHKLITKVNSVAPVDGIFNLAVVLKDSIFEHQSIESMKTSMSPKAVLTEHLDQITRHICPQLSYFVVFSSVSCGRGNAGQTNYGFSNSIMERICELRHKDGLPALAVQWGAVGDVGLLEELQKEQNEIAIGGTLQQKVGNCLQVFDQLIQQKQPVVSSIVVAEKFNKDAADTPIEAVTRILGIQDIKSAGLHTTFPELGMDSMMAVEIRQTMEREFDISLGPNDLRNLTFAKLEDMNAGYGKDKPKVAALHIEMLKMLIPGVIFATSMETIIDFNIKAANCQGDFVLVFPGADADIRAFEQMAGLLHKHIKCVNYDGITRNQENVNVIVDYVFNTLHEDILQKKSFKILAYSIGYLAGIKIVKRIESLGTTGTFIIIDSGPELLYHIYAVIRGKSKEEFHFNIIEALVSTILPNESKLGLKEIMVKGKDLSERVDLMLNHYTDSSVEVKNKLKSLTFSFVSRLRSIESYKKRPIPKEKIKSNVLLYKPSDCIAKGITEDYNLNTICNLCRIDTFDGNHMTILHNEKMLQQLLIDFN